MNIFEDLVIELKEENLLEDTFLDELEARAREIDDEDAAARAEIEDETEAEPEDEKLYDPIFHEVAVLGADAPDSADLQLMGSDQIVELRKPKSEKEFFKKRATGEVTSLQMVDHVLTAVEREQLKTLANTYDDLEVKKALHLFLRVADDTQADEHKEAEFKLMQEIESWCSALAKRDRDIPVGALRRYCETCRPMLSSQAMLSLARFYRNLPYSDAVRGKFDYIITRLFSREVSDETRKLLFGTDETLGHVKSLYADWSSIPLYSADDDSKMNLAAESFADLKHEAEAATRFDDLIRSDFFNRIRLFKESIAELYFAPQVTAAAMECNIAVGNVYVALIDKERRSAGVAVTTEKYATLDDQAVSEAAGRTLELGRTLKNLENGPETDTVNEEMEVVEDHDFLSETVHTPIVKKSGRPEFTMSGGFAERFRRGFFGVNSWILLGSIVLITASLGIYVWANYFMAAGDASGTSVARVQLEGTPFRDQIKVAKVSGETVYAVVLPTWATMPTGKKEDFLRTVYDYGAKGGWKNVNLLNDQGKSVGFASPTHFEIIENPQ